MPGPAERRARAAAPAALRALALLALMLVLGALAGPAAAQTGDDARRAAVSDAAATRIESVIADPDTTTAELEVLRDRLAAQRNEALEAEKALTPAFDEVNNRLQALGDPPTEGVTEPPEIAKRRRDLTQQVANAQAPILEAKEAYQRADGQIAEINRIVRSRFSAELVSRGPSPLRPSVWETAAEELGATLAGHRDALTATFRDPVNQRVALRRLPLTVVWIFGGIVVALIVRRWVLRWIDKRLLATASRRAVAWVVALRNLSRLVVPAVAAGLLFGALDPEGLVARTGEGRFFEIPGFIAVLIAAGWLAVSLFAPRLEAHRLLPLGNAEARRGAWLVLALGVVLALVRIANAAITRSDFSPATQSAIYFPLVILGAVGLWRAARIVDRVRLRLAAPPERGQSPTALVGLRFLLVLARLARAVVIAGPLLAVAGFLPAAAFLVFPSIMTLGLLGGGIVIYDLLNKTALTFLAAPNATDEDGGLIPVIMGTLVTLASLPLLALIWGARKSDLAETWVALNEGVSFGGVRVSVGVILTLIAVFALGAALTRLIQTILRASVLPRTKLDRGGRNAVLAGIGYLGFVMAALVAVSAAGLDLSNIAIVAGALSVGIGFGLQNLVSNFVSGIILLVERPVKEGDWIEVGGFSGYVRGINVRSTEIQTFDRASVILPNSDLVAGSVLNRTHTGTSGRVQIPIGVSYDADPRRVEAILLSIAEAHPLVLLDPAPVVLFMGFGASTMDFEIRCWLRDVNFSLSARSDMNFDIVARFRVEGIEIPIPQHALYLKEMGPLAPASADATAASVARSEGHANPTMIPVPKEG